VKHRLVRGALVLVPLLLFSIYLLRGAGSWLVVQDPLDKADAIVVLGGTFYERPLEAVELINEGWAPALVLMREIADWGEVELMRRGVAYTRPIDLQVDTLRRLGVAPGRIHVLEPSNSTAEEASRVLELAVAQRYSRVIVVTSKQHTRRARLVMGRRLGPAGIDVRVRYSRYDRTDTARWWRQRSSLRFTLFEMQRLLGYWIGVAD
jgi:uncharacterized SAM-binding protein YcdF (DUF218 family)